MTDERTVHRVHPGPATPTTIADAYDVVRTTLGGRPWVDVCMVASLDGAAVLDGASGGLGNATDREVLTTLRRLADIVLVGAGTAAGEGYGPPSKPGQRIAVVTNSGRVDLDRPLFESGAGFVIAPESAAIDESRVDVLRAGRDRVDLAAALLRLGELAGRDVRLVQAEGGPMLNGALWEAGLVDEFDLTISPMLVGGDAHRVVRGAPAGMTGMTLAHLLVDDEGFVFGRWLRR
jgi:riboflavin biosynthesis pyrimidine reductase